MQILFALVQILKYQQIPRWSPKIPDIRKKIPRSGNADEGTDVNTLDARQRSVGGQHDGPCKSSRLWFSRHPHGVCRPKHRSFPPWYVLASRL